MSKWLKTTLSLEKSLNRAAATARTIIPTRTKETMIRAFLFAGFTKLSFNWVSPRLDGTIAFLFLGFNALDHKSTPEERTSPNHP